MHHLTDTQIQGYVRGACAPAQLLSLDDHLTGCQRCRGRSGALAGLAAGVSALLSAVLPAASQLPLGTLQESADRR